jgi:hypothetical protein
MRAVEHIRDCRSDSSAGDIPLNIDQRAFEIAEVVDNNFTAITKDTDDAPREIFQQL